MSLRKAKMLIQVKRKLQKKQILPTQQESQEQETYKVPKKNTFAAFQIEDETQTAIAQQIEQVYQNTQQLKKKKKEKKKKNKTQLKQEQAEIQNIFAQINKQAKQSKVNSIKVQSILHINELRFNYQKELKRHFEDYQAQKKQDNKKQNKRIPSKYLKKSFLLPSFEGIPAQRQCFQLEKIEGDNRGHLIKFVATKRYKSLDIHYQAIRNTNDVNQLFEFMNQNPQHADAMYYAGQFLRLRGDYPAADALLQKVIFLFQCAAGYELIGFVKEDNPQRSIQYDEISKSLFMSVFKYIDILGKKGCFCAALQFNKLLLKLNNNDPCAALLCLDYNAISAQAYYYLLQFIQKYSLYIEKQNCSLYSLPNFIYSYALAKFHLQFQNKQMSEFTEQQWTNALKHNQNELKKQHPNTLLLKAMLIYPRLIRDIAQNNDYSKQTLHHPTFVGNQKSTFQSILNHSFWSDAPDSYSYHFLRLQSLEDSKGLDKLLQVYVQRSKILWKANSVMLWVKAAMGFVLNHQQFDYDKFVEQMCFENCTIEKIPFLLRRYANVNKANFTDKVERINLQMIQNHVPAPQLNIQGNPLGLFFRSLLPWVNLPNAQDRNQPFIEQD